MKRYKVWFEFEKEIEAENQKEAEKIFLDRLTSDILYEEEVSLNEINSCEIKK